MCFIMGTVFFLIQKEYVIIRLPYHKQTNSHMPSPETDTIKKEISYYFWHKEQWLEEQRTGLWSDNKDINLKHLISTWLTIAQEEGILDHKVQVQAVALNHNGYIAFVSLDQNPIPRNTSIYIKLCFIQGLLKTIQLGGIALQSIYFLHNHAPLLDSHIDFSQPWPIEGFLPR